MFENIIGQNMVTEKLKREIGSGTLPGSLLFYGEPFTGKVSTALETARSLTCEFETAEWACRCKSCRKQRLLEHTGTLLIGPRDVSAEIAASGEALMRTRRAGAAYLYYRSVKKLLRRFDPMLWEGSEIRLKKIQTPLSDIEEAIDAFTPEAEIPDGKALKKMIGAIQKNCAKIVQSGVIDSLSVNQVRNISYWAHTSTTVRRRVIILENAHLMQDSARNALLKILEEPPADVYFILTTSRRGAIIPTILSRLRTYHFPIRSLEADREVLEQVFRESDSDYTTLRDYFLAWNELNPEGLRNESREFLREILEGRTDGSVERHVLERAMEIVSNPKAFRPFLDELTSTCRAFALSADSASIGDIDRVNRLNRAIRECSMSHERYNQNPVLLIESLYYSLIEDGIRS
jgi:DNA polymerase III delta prime subunit